MINWKAICGSRCAIDSFDDWLEQDMTDAKLLTILRGLGLKSEANEVGTYFRTSNHRRLARYTRAAFRRHGV